MNLCVSVPSPLKCPSPHTWHSLCWGWWISTMLCCVWWERAARGTFWLCVELIKRIFTARLTRIFTLYANMWNTINKGRQFAGTHTRRHTCTHTSIKSHAPVVRKISFLLNFTVNWIYTQARTTQTTTKKKNRNNNNQNCALLNSMKIAREHWNWGGCGRRRAGEEEGG